MMAVHPILLRAHDVNELREIFYTSTLYKVVLYEFVF